MPFKPVDLTIIIIILLAIFLFTSVIGFGIGALIFGTFLRSLGCSILIGTTSSIITLMGLITLKPWK